MSEKEEIEGECASSADGRDIGPRTRQRASSLETPAGPRSEWNTISRRDFSGFRDDKSYIRRLIGVERELQELRDTKEVLDTVSRCQEELTKDIKERRKENAEVKKSNDEVKKMCEDYQIMKQTNAELKLNIDELMRENAALKVKCTNYEKALEDINEKVESSQTKVDNAVNKKH